MLKENIVTTVKKRVNKHFHQTRNASIGIYKEFVTGAFTFDNKFRNASYHYFFRSD